MRHALFALAAALALSTAACGGDPVKPKPKAAPPYRDLTQKDHVLLNLERAYTERNCAEVARMLADDFTFHFAPTDISNGNVQVESWRLQPELDATAHLFGLSTSPQGVGPAGAARVEGHTWGRIKATYADSPSGPGLAAVDTIALTLAYPPGDGAWQEVAAPDTVPGPWFEKAVSYTLSITAGNTTFLNSTPLDASFVIRPIVAGGRTTWRIVDWRDGISH